MLRSLVGSEMCIRDRVSDAPEAFINSMINGIVGLEVVVEQVEAKAKLSQNRPLPDRIGVIAGLQACLLYTSDAADDLLCVDLGGRRIIKKNKKQQHTHTIS